MNGAVLWGRSVDLENRVHRSHGRDGPRSLIVHADGALKTVPFHTAPYSLRQPLPGLALDRRTEDFPDVFGDFLLAFGGGVDAVGLVEFFDSADAFEEEGDEGGLGFFGDFGEDGFVAGDEVGPHVVGHLHAGYKDLGIGVFGAGAGDDAEQVLFGFLGGNAAQAVVAAKRDDQDVGSFSQRPSDAAQAASGGVAADSGVGDGVGQSGGGDFLLEDGGVGLFQIKAVACGDAVTEDDDAFLGIACICSRLFGE